MNVVSVLLDNITSASSSECPFTIIAIPLSVLHVPAVASASAEVEADAEVEANVEVEASAMTSVSTSTEVKAGILFTSISNLAVGR